MLTVGYLALTVVDVGVAQVHPEIDHAGTLMLIVECLASTVVGVAPTQVRQGGGMGYSTQEERGPGVRWTLNLTSAREAAPGVRGTALGEGHFL